MIFSGENVSLRPDRDGETMRRIHSALRASAAEVVIRLAGGPSAITRETRAGINHDVALMGSLLRFAAIPNEFRPAKDLLEVIGDTWVNIAGPLGQIGYAAEAFTEAMEEGIPPEDLGVAIEKDERGVYGFTSLDDRRSSGVDVAIAIYSDRYGQESHQTMDDSDTGLTPQLARTLQMRADTTGQFVGWIAATSTNIDKLVS